MGAELSHDLSILRTMRSLHVGEFCGMDAYAHWCEWNHKHESVSSLNGQIHAAFNSNWPRFIRPGGVVIDIGGYSGDTAIPMAVFGYDKENRRPATVIAVEPNPDVFAVMQINLLLNSHLGKFIPVQAAVTPPGVTEIEIADLGTANCNMGIISEQFSAPLKDRLHEVTLNKFIVPGISLAEIIRKYVPRERVSEISFIKIDCEGYDKEILLSARDVLSVIRPAIFVEWFAMFSDVESRELFRVIGEIGYVPLDPKNLLETSVDKRLPDLMIVPQERMGNF